MPEVKLAQTKVEHLLEPLIVPEDSVSEEDEIDTLEAHAELIKMREKLRVERLAVNDQVRFYKLLPIVIKLQIEKKTSKCAKLQYLQRAECFDYKEIYKNLPKNQATNFRSSLGLVWV